MVNRKAFYIAVAASLFLAGLSTAREFYLFPWVNDVQDRDIFMIRRPAANGFDNITGTRNITGAAFRSTFALNSTVTVALEGKSNVGHGHTIPYISGLQEILDGKVADTDPRLSDARTPLAHDQAISTITGLQTALDVKVDTNDPRLSDARAPLAHTQTADTITDGITNKAFTATEKSKLATIATGATVQVNSDWSATSGITQILNRPPELCPGRFSYDGSVIFTGAGAPTIDTGVKNDFYINTANGDYYRKEGEPVAWALKSNLTGRPGDPGPAGKSYTCAITGGIRTIEYDSNGLNPTPTMTAFGVEMRENGDIVSPVTFAWSVPVSGSILSGSSSTASFTPTVDSTWSAGAADNRVDVVITYAGQTCQATAPIAVSKIGATGTAGSPDTKQQIYAKIDDPTTGDVLRTQCGPGDAASFVAREVIDPSGNIILSYTCGGVVTVYQLPGDAASDVKLQVKDTGGIVRFSVTAGGLVTIR